jgi:hypothetical protein
MRSRAESRTMTRDFDSMDHVHLPLYQAAAQLPRLSHELLLSVDHFIVPLGKQLPWSL